LAGWRRLRRGDGLKTDYGNAYVYRGLVLIKKHDYRNATADFTKAAPHDPSNASSALNNRANAYELIGEYDQALEDYGRAIKLNPKNAVASFNRAGLYYTKAEYEDAIKDYDRAIDVKPDYIDAYNNRGKAYQAKGEINNALADFDIAVQCDPYNTAALQQPEILIEPLSTSAQPLI
jgi:tetratricopeptide (TPR) repeat protein